MTADTIVEAAINAHVSQIQLEFRLNEAGKAEMYLNGENVESEIRNSEVANGASRVSTLGCCASRIGSSAAIDGRAERHCNGWP
jgi:cytidylate kinase